jgi:hypothetical protein
MTTLPNNPEPLEPAVEAAIQSLCLRMESAGGACLRGRQLAAEMGLADTRALRRLVALARVSRHRHEIVGVPGEGYYWGPAMPADRVRRVIQAAGQMGRAWFYIASLLRRQGTVMAMVQQAFDFMGGRGEGSHGHDDELAALAASEGTSIAGFLDAFLVELGKTPAGRATLAEVGRRHQGLLLSEPIREAMLNKLDEMRASLMGLKIAT